MYLPHIKLEETEHSIRKSNVITSNIVQEYHIIKKKQVSNAFLTSEK